MPESLADWVTLQAERRPDAVAVVGDGLALTYAELEVRSNRIARVLEEGGCARGDRVCLLMAKSTHAIAGLLGIYKAGGIYVPLDPSSPPARLVSRYQPRSSDQKISSCASEPGLPATSQASPSETPSVSM